LDEVRLLDLPYLLFFLSQKMDNDD
jgi:hypothetical protein